MPISALVTMLQVTQVDEILKVLIFVLYILKLHSVGWYDTDRMSVHLMFHYLSLFAVKVNDQVRTRKGKRRV